MSNPNQQRIKSLIKLARYRADETTWFEYEDWKDLLTDGELTEPELDWMHENLEIKVLVRRKDRSRPID